MVTLKQCLGADIEGLCFRSSCICSDRGLLFSRLAGQLGFIAGQCSGSNGLLFFLSLLLDNFLILLLPWDERAPWLRPSSCVSLWQLSLLSATHRAGKIKFDIPYKKESCRMSNESLPSPLWLLLWPWQAGWRAAWSWREEGGASFRWISPIVASPVSVRDSSVALCFCCGGREYQECTVSPAACRGEVMILEYSA